jgi:hypothetical protein
VAAELTNSASDAAALPKVLKAVQANPGQSPGQALADTGYRSEAVFQQLDNGPTQLIVALGREGKEQLKLVARLQSDEGKEAYGKRKWIAEPPTLRGPGWGWPLERNKGGACRTRHAGDIRARGHPRPGPARATNFCRPDSYGLRFARGCAAS